MGSDGKRTADTAPWLGSPERAAVAAAGGDSPSDEDHAQRRQTSRIKTKAESEPLCLGGKRACPAEDCGGPWGYRELLNLVTRGPSSDEDRERLDWLGPDFDPARFDVDETTEAMRSPMGW